jgi:hypothetical protein
MEMAPAVLEHPGTRPTERMATVDTTKFSATERTNQDQELLAAACSAMRLLQDRQRHVPEEMLDGRERRVLRQLRDAVRKTVGDK